MLVVQDQLTRFPVASLVPSTAAVPVIKDEIYDSFGNPEVQQTDNGPPFNSAAFGEMSSDQGIEHVRVYEYHPQANPSETFMKPLGKTMKAATMERKDHKQALSQLLSNYHSTPHSATQQAPGDMLFRSGYRTLFPRKSLSTEEFERARELEFSERRRGQKSSINLDVEFPAR